MRVENGKKNISSGYTNKLISLNFSQLTIFTQFGLRTSPRKNEEHNMRYIVFKLIVTIIQHYAKESLSNLTTANSISM